MASLNRVSLIGNLGKDPEVRSTPSGAKVASFSIGITERFKDRNGTQQEKTEWVNVVLWNRLGEIAEQYLRKGSSVYVEGKISTSSWDDPQGQKRYKTEVIVSNMQMLGSKQQGSQPSQQAPQNQGYDSPPNYQNQEESELPF